jgi:hypothetical protein
LLSIQHLLDGGIFDAIGERHSSQNKYDIPQR